MKKVIIASKNPVKIESTRIAFEEMFPDEKFEFVGVSVPSNVTDQPMSSEETYTGAINRLNNAMNEFKDAHYWVGIEGGIEKSKQGMEVFAWIVIKSKSIKDQKSMTSSKEGKAKTGTFFLPRKVIELVEQGIELGKADDIVFGKKDSKHNSGSVGILTGEVRNRTQYYVEAVILALIPFKNKDLY